MFTVEVLSARLEAFRSAGRDLQLDPLVTEKDLARLGVEYQAELVDELESAIEDSVGKDNKLVFTGHRGCGKSTLLAELGFRLKDSASDRDGFVIGRRGDLDVKNAVGI